MTWKPDLCIYHANCDDGFAAAFVVNHRWPGTPLLPASYGDAPPDVTGKNVLIVDFSYKLDVTQALARQASSIVILDHHKTARDDLAPFVVPELSLTVHNVQGLINAGHTTMAAFDMNRSGARMAWEFCFPGKVGVPWLIQYVEDRDLWRFKIPLTREVSAALRSYPRDLNTWKTLAVNRLAEEGKSILRAHEQIVTELVKGVYQAPLLEYLVPTLNVPPMYASDCGDRLLTMFPEAPFVALWSLQPGGTVFSLRSTNDRADVSQIASRMGGGGHRNAAGFKVPG